MFSFEMNKTKIVDGCGQPCRWKADAYVHSYLDPLTKFTDESAIEGVNCVFNPLDGGFE